MNAMKRKSTETHEEILPKRKKSRVTLEIKPLKTIVGSLYEFQDASNDGLSVEIGSDQDPLMSDVLDMKSTKKDLIVLHSSGKVTVLLDGKAEKRKEFSFSEKAIAISAGSDHGACLLESGEVFIWGGFENPGYEYEHPYVPVPIMEDYQVVDIASGYDHLVALTNEGAVLTMGSGAHGQLGRVTAKASLDGGRFGLQLLLTPRPIHMHHTHKSDRIWATQFGTFYRNAQTQAIYGCGKNDQQNVAAAQEKHQTEDFIYKPVLTNLKDISQIGEALILTKKDHLMTLTSAAGETEGNFWSRLGEKGRTVHYGIKSTHFVDLRGCVYEFKSKKKITCRFMSREEDFYGAFCVAKVKQNLFLLVA